MQAYIGKRANVLLLLKAFPFNDATSKWIKSLRLPKDSQDRAGVMQSD